MPKKYLPINFLKNQNINYIIATLDNQVIFIDTEHKNIIENFNKSRFRKPKWSTNENKLIYTEDTNMKPIYLYEILYNTSQKIYDIKFENGNYFDYRKNNIKLELNKIYTLPDKFSYLKILESYPGHISQSGKAAGKMKNQYWMVQENDKIYYIMYCDVDSYCKFSIESLDKISSIKGIDGFPTWFKMSNGYIATHYENTILYMHAHIMNHFGNGRGSLSVDHINRDTLDNRIENLRIVNQSEQNKNTDKRTRNKNAQKLPIELDGTILPKYVTYNREKITNGNGTYYRDFFRIEKHPKLNKNWSSSKSKNVGILEKLEETKEKLEEIETEIKKPIPLDGILITYPKYIRESVDKRTNKNILVFEKKENGKRLNVTLTMYLDKSKEENLDILKQKIYDKYKINI